jgi:hypothetical protein
MPIFLSKISAKNVLAEPQQPGQDWQDETARTGLQDKTISNRQPGQDKGARTGQDKAARTGPDKATSTGQLEQTEHSGHHLVLFSKRKIHLHC